MGVAPREHAVVFYDHDPEAVEAVAEYVAEGLRQGEPVVVIATEEHREAFDLALLGFGADPEWARATGQYQALDAAATLRTFMVRGLPDPELFEASVGGVVRAAGRGGAKVRAFGEMVALLWDEGNVVGAIALEALWNGLAQRLDFFLLCAYPTRALGTGSLAEVTCVCDLHSEVLPPSRYEVPFTGSVAPDLRQRSEVFVPVPEAVGAARRLVANTLESWGVGHLVWEAALVTSELATNALRHGGSPFRAVVDRRAGVVRIAVEDAGPGLPERRTAAPHDFGGRGMLILDRLCHRWGVERHRTGKTIWAELLLSAPVTAAPAR